MAQFDVTEVVREFLGGAYARERNELISEFSRAFEENRALKLMLAEIGAECADLKDKPIRAVGRGMMYGMALGVLLERERELRSKRPA